MSVAGVREEARQFRTYLRALRDFFQTPVASEGARPEIERRIASRAASFLEVADRGIYAEPASPYKALLAHAGVEREDLRRLVHERGVEGALAALHERGVYLTIDELKGRTPIRRGSLELDVTAADFDNPLTVAHYRSQTGGSGGSPRPLLLSLDSLKHVLPYYRVVLAAHGVQDRPFAMWGPLPPSTWFLLALLFAKIGMGPERWFAHSGLRFRPSSLRPFLLIAAAARAARRSGVTIAFPKDAPSEHSIAAWLAEKRAAGTAALQWSTASSAVRICRAAREGGLQIEGTVFWVGGEPLTQAKAAEIEAAGCRVMSSYGTTEIGAIGFPCAAPAAADDVHVCTDAVALLERPRPVGNGATVDALFLTGLHPFTPKLMLNVESGDYAILEERDCGCLLHEVGYTQHLHTIRSYEKLTSEGMTFLDDDLIRLIEEVLPRRFGGSSTDYQFVEREEKGLTRVALVVSPRVGPVDEEALRARVLSALASAGRPQAMMAGVWAEHGTLQIERREPYTTSGSKVLPLHLVSGARART
ncbi:MAG: hypothetical protein ACREQQ_15615 [Candidatus Binatia bacterium]